MRQLTPWLLALALLLPLAAQADPIRDPAFFAQVDRGPSWEAEMRSQAPQIGNCRTGVAERDLDINNVRARMYNIGNLFWRSGDPVYVVPANGTVSSVFAHGLWIGGRIDGELRIAATAYAQGGGFEFWPGPLNDDGTLPNANDCSQYDRLFKVSRADILNYEATGIATPDLEAWPYQLGAPVIDGDGVPGNYNLAGGDRPDIIGDQGIWWVMNDVGNLHLSTGSLPIGLEVQVLAFAFSRSDALNDATFYQYTITYKGQQPLEDTYMALFSDPDVGDYADDYIGSDPGRGLGFAYNGQPVDSEYGNNPPAVGYNFFRGPRIINDDGEEEELAMSVFTYYNNGGAGGTGDPRNGTEYYNYMTGFWQDGVPFLFGGDGRNAATGGPTQVVYPNSPPEFWSEACTNGNAPGSTDGCSSAAIPADRRFVISSGPFTMNPGETQVITFGIVWAQGSRAGFDDAHFDSVRAMKAASDLAQTAFDINFELAPPPDPPQVQAVNLDGQGVITWSYAPTSNNYLGRFSEPDPLLRGQTVSDSLYNFQGFNIYRFPNSTFNPNEAEYVTTYDIADGVTTIVDIVNDPITGPTPFVAARGRDSGIRYYHVVEGLTNYTDYYYGVSAYAYNEESIPKVLESPISPVTVRPARITAAASGASTQGQVGDAIRADLSRATGGGTIRARVVDPLSVRDASYEIEMITVQSGDCGVEERSASANAGSGALQSRTRQNLVEGVASNVRIAPAQSVRGESGATTAQRGGQPCVEQVTYVLRRVSASGTEVILDGAAYYAETGELLPIGQDFFVYDGLSFTIFDQEPGPVLLGEADNGDPIYGFTEVVGPGGADPCEPNAAGFAPFGCQDGYGAAVYGRSPVALNSTGEYAVFNNNGVFGTLVRPEDPTAPWPGGPERHIGQYVPNDYEIRFTERGSIGLLQRGVEVTLRWLPFEVWKVGPVNPFTENDPSNDVRLLPTYTSASGDVCFFGYGDGFYNAQGNIERGFNFQFNDGIRPIPGLNSIAAEEIQGTRTYEEFEELALQLMGGDDCVDLPLSQVLQINPFRNANSTPLRNVVFLDVLEQYVADPTAVLLPPQGIVVRFSNTNPIQAGDIYTLDASNASFLPDDPEISDEDVLALIGVTPNPYRGVSLYERDNLDRVMRFINLPDQATIRIFTLSGTLIRILEKNDPASRSLDWDLTTQRGLPIASGMYLAHVETPFGNKVLKLGIVNRRIQLENY